jgi:hypothetical protein
VPFLPQNAKHVRRFLTNFFEGAPMPTYQPSLKMMQALMNTETRSALSLPVAAVITAALSQVESTIELTNRVCDRVFHRSMKAGNDTGTSSVNA